MQTFLPDPDFATSAAVLDRARLGKQRVEVLQLLKAVSGSGGWANHPAARMWAEHTNALVEYGVRICQEWTGRGYRDTCQSKILEYYDLDSPYVLPTWLGDVDFHAAHRSNLLRKYPEWYGMFGWKEPPDLPYVWPSHKELK